MHVSFEKQDLGEDIETGPESEKRIEEDLLMSLRELESHREKLLGVGNYAQVFEPKNASSKLCYKIFHNELFPSIKVAEGKNAALMPDAYEAIKSNYRYQKPKDWTLSSLAEGRVTAEVHTFANSHQNLVRVPAMYQHFNLDISETGEGYEVEDKLEALAMERISGSSIDQIIGNKMKLPENFNVDVFFNRLREFVRIMHEELRTYHRDIHPGNIMIDKEGNPVLIDFGKSKAGVFGDEDPYFEVLPGGRRKEQRGINDEQGLKEVEEQLREYIASIDS